METMTFDETLEALERALARAKFVATSGCWPDGRYATTREFNAAYARVVAKHEWMSHP